MSKATKKAKAEPVEMQTVTVLFGIDNTVREYYEVTFDLPKVIFDGATYSEEIGQWFIADQGDGIVDAILDGEKQEDGDSEYSEESIESVELVDPQEDAK